MNALDVRVKGVFSTGVPDIDQRLVYADIATAQKPPRLPLPRHVQRTCGDGPACGYCHGQIDLL